ncbi:MAG: FKBP-type peptidyl-prolyl cis-trans isomerase [Fimbriimonas sp.]|nr:FKBP-type peptidyl-prolyl cis-trans isomerase [Fimbriimonas sp.]
MILGTLVAVLATQNASIQAPQADVRAPNGVVVSDDHIGGGKLLEAGDKITIQYRVWDSLNREIANSTKRGLPYTLIVGMRNSDPLVSVALPGMRAGGIRTVSVPAEYFPDGIGGIVPARTDLHLWINVIAAKAQGPAKVESANAERTQGTLEVPGALAHNGPARD